jgi:hypothetical protein
MIKPRRVIGGACGTNGKKRNGCRIVVGKPKRKETTKKTKT